jgi:signal transduction histidine kinase/DNA-binding NarL/FixJ family response regulator
MVRRIGVVMRPKLDRILDYREFPILYVDDEPENLRIFELAFRREFSIVTAPNAEEALSIINAQPVAIVLSDQKMPGMEGTEFLGRVAELDPKTIRILVTAYGDAETLESAINWGAIYRYVSKPWSPEDMRLALRRGIEVYALDGEREQLLRELTLLNQVSKSISQELDLDTLSKLLVDTVTDDFGYDAAGILLLDKSGNDLRWKELAGGDSEVNAAIGSISFSRANAPAFIGAIEKGQTQVFSVCDVLDMETAVRKWITEVAAEETIVLPLSGKERVIGALVVDNRKGRSGFLAEDWTLLEGLSNQAVIAIQNALLVEDLRRSREQVMRNDRLGTLGTLAAGLAHEINNPLVSIRTFLSMAPSRRRDSDDEFWVDYHSIAFDEVERIRRLVETMQGLGRGGANGGVRECFGLGDLARQVITLVQREATANGLALTVGIGEECEIVAVRDQIHQLILNLLLNAIHSAGVDGAVDLRIAKRVDTKSVALEVQDSGAGISPGDLERIFDPFFTTKGPDEGTGLGLMICHRIVSEHGGMIEVEGREGEGAVFRVIIPLGNVSAG